MRLIMELGMNNIVDFIKIFFICIFTYVINCKVIDKKFVINFKRFFIVVIGNIVIAMICKLIKETLSFSYSVIFMI